MSVYADRPHRWHLLILDELGRSTNLSQRSLAKRLGIAASLVNRTIRELLDGGYLTVVSRDVMPFAYRLTAAGKDYHSELSHYHYSSVVGSFRNLQERIRRTLREIEAKNMGRVVFYGAGEIMEVTFPLASALSLEVVGVVDDDPAKQGSRKGQLVVRPSASINELEPDVVLISTFRHARKIRSKLNPELRSSVRVLEL